MTLNEAIMQLVEIHESVFMPTLFKPALDKVIETVSECEEPTAKGMTFAEIAQLLSDLCGECACDVNGNDEWLPQACKYADTECPHPKEKNGCWMQFLMQGGADMRGDEK